MVYGTKSALTGDWGDFGPASSDWKETTPEQIREDLERLCDAMEQARGPDTVLVDPEWFSRLLFQRAIYEEEKQFWCDFCGYRLRVVVSSRVPVGELLICRWGDVQAEVGEDVEDCTGHTYWKAEPKMFRCRICGTRYQSKGEAKQCQREHEWQNRKARR